MSRDASVENTSSVAESAPRAAKPGYATMIMNSISVSDVAEVKGYKWVKAPRQTTAPTLKLVGHPIEISMFDICRYALEICGRPYPVSPEAQLSLKLIKEIAVEKAKELDEFEIGK